MYNKINYILPDGTPCKEFFTVLCSPTNGYFTPTQNANIFTFSYLNTWLQNLYLLRSSLPVSSTLIETICRYIFRIIDQSKLTPLQENKITGKGGIFHTPNPADSAVLQSLRILRNLCHIDHECILPIQSIMETLIQSNIAQNNSNIFLEVLRFFVECSSEDYDLTSHFNTFFLQILPKNFTSSSFSLDVLLFCNKYKERLLSSSRILQSYFPSLLKLFCWFPMSNAR